MVQICYDAIILSSQSSSALLINISNTIAISVTHFGGHQKGKFLTYKIPSKH